MIKLSMSSFLQLHEITQIINNEDEIFYEKKS